MTLGQLKRTHRSYLAEFDRAVKRRRADMVRFFAYQIRERKKMANPNKPSAAKAQKLKRKMMNFIHRSVFNNAANPRCARWKRLPGGQWYTTNPRRCPA